MRTILAAGLAALLLTACSEAAEQTGPLTDETWALTFDTPYYGELTGRFSGRVAGRHIYLESESELTEQLAALPSEGDWFPEGATLSFRLRGDGDGGYEGRFAALTASFRRGYQNTALTLDGAHLSGAIADGGPFSGEVTGAPLPGNALLRDYAAINTRIHQTMRAHVFNPALLEEPTASEAMDIQAALANNAVDDFDLILAYAFTTRRMPFSHFGLTRPRGGLDALMAARMTRGADGAPVELSVENDIAVLTATSFVGEEIPQQITNAFSEIEQSGARALIIDLRENGGGSFAGAVLGNHIFSEPQPIGYFVTNLWWREHARAPGIEDAASVPVFEGRTLDEFYAAVETSPMIRVESAPVASPFSGPVFVLASARSTSMTELLLDAVRQTGRGTIIGTATPGEMVSSRFFDVGEDFVLRLPVADYFSWENGRLEGVGVSPDIEEDGDALARALELARDAMLQE